VTIGIADKAAKLDVLFAMTHSYITTQTHTNRIPMWLSLGEPEIIQPNVCPLMAPFPDIILSSEHIFART
jgi:hypothetical protein